MMSAADSSSAASVVYKRQLTLASALPSNVAVTPSPNLIAQSVPAALTAASLDDMSDDLNSLQVQAANLSDTITTSQNLSGPSRLVIVDPEVEDLVLIHIFEPTRPY